MHASTKLGLPVRPAFPHGQVLTSKATVRRPLLSEPRLDPGWKYCHHFISIAAKDIVLVTR